MYQRILVAVDGSRPFVLAIDQATIVAKATGAQVKVLFVADNSELFFEVSYRDPTDVMSEIMNFGQKVLAAAVERFTAAGGQCVTGQIERTNSPNLIASTIAAEARNWKANLIVLGTRGRRGIRRLALGSVFPGVIRKTDLPVLLIRGKTHAYGMQP